MNWVWTLPLPAVFLGVAGASKLAHNSSFARHLAVYGFPGWTLSTLRWAVPIVELGLATALLVPGTRVPASIGGVVLLLVFSVALVRGRLLTRDYRCECLGLDGGGESFAVAVVRNAALVGLLVASLSTGATDPVSLQSVVAAAHVMAWYLLVLAIHQTRRRRRALDASLVQGALP